MKNISMSVTPFVNAPLPAYPAPPLGLPATINKSNYSFSFSAQFEKQEEALDFAAFIIQQLLTIRKTPNA
jgi:hypothetical protein